MAQEIDTMARVGHETERRNLWATECSNQFEANEWLRGRQSVRVYVPDPKSVLDWESLMVSCLCPEIAGQVTASVLASL